MDANEFRDKITALPEPTTSLKPPYWAYWRWELWHLAQTQDVSNFYEWPCIRHTMLVQHWIDAITYEWRELDRKRFNQAEHLRGILSLSETSFRDNFFKHILSNNLIHQAYHLQQWERTTGQRIENLKSIVEFGGGYGAMCLLCHELGFRGKYIIYDLPEFSLLQQYYLSQCHIEADWNPRRKPKDIDLFIALYSLSEVKRQERAYLICTAKSYLCLYSGMWEKWDNVHWFQVVLPAMFDDLEWKHSEIQHLPDKQNWYSIGW